MIYITGDTHGCFERIEYFCDRKNTTQDDILIILGDAGINFSGSSRDIQIKDYLKTLPITLFCIHGNHERRPQTIPTYKERCWNDGIVFYEEEYPNLLFAKDGEVFNLDGLKTIVIGGAYSIDKEYRLIRGWHWFPDEQPSEEIKQYVEQQLEQNDWDVDVVLSHTAPLKYEPTELFMSGIDQSKVDKSTESWLDSIEERLQYQQWYFGHYHGNKRIDKMIMLFEATLEFTIEQ